MTLHSFQTKEKLNLILLFTIGSLFSFSVKSQTVQFYETYSATSEITFNSIKVLQNGNYIVAGQYYGSNGGDYFLLQSDTSGNEIWRKQNNQFTQFYDSSTLAYDIVETVNKNLIICGNLISTSNGYNSQFYLASTDSMGNQLWQKSFGDNDLEKLLKIISLPDFSFLSVGYKSNPPLSDIYLIKFDTCGNTIWDTTYSFPPYNSQPTFLDERNNKILISSILRDTLSQFRHGLICVLDSTGTLLDSASILDTIPLTPVSCHIDTNNTFSLLTWSRSIHTNYGTIYNLDSSLNLLTSHIFSNFQAAKYINDSQVVGGSGNILTIKGDTSGQIIWQNYTAEPYGEVNDITWKSGYSLTCGKIDIDQNTIAQGFILKVIDTTFINSISNELVLQNVDVYPNPTKENIFIKVDSQFISKKQDLSITYYDTQGKIILKDKIIREVTISNLSHFRPGLYIFIIKSIDEIITKGQIVLQ